ncbi:hypothetical protein O181_112335 [Austropuccinia psidii MF-1]|uniref:Uncharacterized protein n=1 Tax=Austropuccinia psidii MF-1 TaxID=1389203 RepID=A0A9Q3K493_9BASI|nr:hypothetical protein [Austropuccinia psidii MF-1]
MHRVIENKPQEEVKCYQEVEQGPSTEALSSQITPEEPKLLSWYLDNAIKENNEWDTFDPKKGEEWSNINLPPSSEYDDYIKKPSIK